MTTPPPEPFAALKHLAEEGDATQRAKSLTEALKAVPDLNVWLRQARQEAVLEMRDEGASHADVGKAIGTSRARAQQIAEGRTTGKRADEGKPPAAAPAPDA